MAVITISSLAEQQAEKAENLKAFCGIKLLNIKNSVAAMLRLIGRDGIFDEYTKHDISHIDAMLNSLDYLIPEETKNQMTPSDWLMLTLAIYFHDLGMLVTRDEFANRDKSSFPAFKTAILNGESGSDYKDKIQAMPEDQRDRFIYQELVRKTHAERVKYWILDESNPKFYNVSKTLNEVRKLLSPIDNMFRRDLAIICESHHLSDLDDFEKYKANAQYGTTSDEVVNLHFCALLLRTSDLLHITSDRTPSVEYRLISPNDPVSQDEWAKQRAVKAVRPQDKKNKEGNIDKSIQPDALEVIALFTVEEGYFGLISYLNYARTQLQESRKLNELCNKHFGTSLIFPWRDIDDSQVQATDFEKRQFEFTLDQTKILDLLVGHTLYNDSSVVLRELTQNAIDASKLMAYEYKIAKAKNSYNPEIQVKWDSAAKELSFTDNGTGMTLEVIQNHLLKVGSSRYQDEAFKKKYPEFSPISRFGIGLLTCFLIADDIDIFTKSNGQDKAILLKIRKVHGKYLLKYISNDAIPPAIANHGTQIKLRTRSDVDLSNLERDMKKWILFPSCPVTLELDGEIMSIGYKSPKDFLESYLEEMSYSSRNNKIKVKEMDMNGITLAFAVKHIEHWNEWVFLEYLHDMDGDDVVHTGTCVEGIRVDSATPGFQGNPILAIANCSGKNAPKTNVARSNIEMTAERSQLLSSVYSIYMKHIEEEVTNLRQQGFSITWAANEIEWMLNSLLVPRRRDSGYRVEDLDLFKKSLMQIGTTLIEHDGKRELVDIERLKEIGAFWTIDCASYTSANSLIKEVKSSRTSALELLTTIFGGTEAQTDHIDHLLCSKESNMHIDSIIKNLFQVSCIKTFPDQRRLDLKWTCVGTEARLWKEINLEDSDYYHNPSVCYVQQKDIDIDIDSEMHEIAICSSNALFILKNSELNTYLLKISEQLSGSNEDFVILSWVVSFIKDMFRYKKSRDRAQIEEYIDNQIEHNDNRRRLNTAVWQKLNREEFISTMLKTDFVKYDTSIWSHRDFFRY